MPPVCVVFRVRGSDELKKLEETDAEGLEKLLALPDEELWERHVESYPKAYAGHPLAGQHILSQPDLGYDVDPDTPTPRGLVPWYEEPENGRQRGKRFENLMLQGLAAQQQVRRSLHPTLSMAAPERHPCGSHRHR